MKAASAASMAPCGRERDKMKASGEGECSWRCVCTDANFVSTFQQDGDKDVPCGSPIFN